MFSSTLSVFHPCGFRGSLPYLYSCFCYKFLDHVIHDFNHGERSEDAFEYEVCYFDGTSPSTSLQLRPFIHAPRSLCCSGSVVRPSMIAISELMQTYSVGGLSFSGGRLHAWLYAWLLSDGLPNWKIAFLDEPTICKPMYTLQPSPKLS